MTSSSPSWIDSLPKVRGKYREYANLAETTWFRVGGAAEVLFKPEDAEDLADFIRACPKDIPWQVLGVGSNVIIRDGGVEGVVIRLGRGFTQMEVSGEIIIAGAANLDVNVSQFALQESLTGLEFLSGIPGTIGGAVAMNAGAYGSDISQVLIEAEAVSPQGEIVQLKPTEIGFSYRHNALGAGWIFTKVWLKAAHGHSAQIAARMAEISAAREASQPVRSRTGGSTFKNPLGIKAWEAIDAAGCRGMMLGGAQVSEQHCNFLINTGSATAHELEMLAEAVRGRVKDHSGVELEWEIKRIGKPR